MPTRHNDPEYPEHCPECEEWEGGCPFKPCDTPEEHVFCGPHIAEARAEAQEREWDYKRGN